ncbi:MAG: ABC transporter substrate-binding protein [Geothrix sp.]|uniref:ABC transporter substrate-binding protein n=1 Tax=Geothrix sp. TaxID=1962974 RepID=UPI0017CD7ACF|nr:ABC transporter substrate-binding protein [Geothrix sp.]NWJ41636.1 ABC transporter substrate-binding protein [Geothrix sp.]WIL20382.1 MAG: ABC transporter substrate-binding protein [Geothrix sp.]
MQESGDPVSGAGWSNSFGRILAGILGLSLLLAPPALARDKKPKTIAGLPEAKALALGERMYREGILPSGEPMQSVVSTDVPVAGTSFSCASCHLRGGLGSWEGGIVTLPTNGAKLAQPRYWKFPNLSPEERAELKLQNPQARPAYTDPALARVIRVGIDPSGYELHAAMPRYELKDKDMAVLVHYLRNLSAEWSPGVDATTIRFATVITEEVRPEDQEAMLAPMNNYVARHNQLSSGFGNRMYLAPGGSEMSGAYRKLSLSVWRLKGAPETWDRQLSAYLAKEPVFALLGGISYGEWRPIHTFCENHRLPCLFPLTDLPVVSETDWYTQYFSKGYYQEGQAAARYLQSLDERAATERVLQIVQEGPEGRDLSAGFRETWQELGLGVAKQIRLGKGEQVDAVTLGAILQREQPTAVLLWTDASCFEALGDLAGRPEMPKFVFLASSRLGAQIYKLPEQARPFTWLTYPYRDPQVEPNVSKYANSLFAGFTNRNPETRIATRTYSMIQILIQGLMDMDRNYYRDNFMDRIGMQRDQVLPDYLRLSFGPGQRYASKGCYIMQLSPGPEPRLVRKSEWVTH